jgi:hypothetical protein
MKLYSGIDLHSTNSFLSIIDESGKRIFKEKLPNEIAMITEKLSLYSGTLEGVVVVNLQLVLACRWADGP